MVWAFNKDFVDFWAFHEFGMSEGECNKLVASVKNDLVKGQTLGDTTVRDSHIKFIDQNEYPHIYSHMADLTKHLNDQYFKFDIWGFEENLQFSEYNVGGKYDEHIDKTYGNSVRKLTIVLQLTDQNSYTGGDLEIVLGKDKVFPMLRKQGSICVFPSYMMHRVAPVTSGTRHSLVGWVSGPQFR